MARPIPAWAGQPIADGGVVLAGEAYPRVGGAAKLLPFQWYGGKGLSPRGRGSQSWMREMPTRRGPIPAWAGQPTPRTSTASCDRAYPRVGGAADSRRGHARSTGGLSPRGRGSRSRGSHSESDWRPIPAWAGQPLRRTRRSGWSQAYPRVGGAAVGGSSHSPQLPGLSPRGRGSLIADQGEATVGGPIPAWAGQPGGSVTIRLNTEAYPRVGGAASAYPLPVSALDGLSPRGRGSHRCWSGSGQAQRPIPAWAGQPPPRRPSRSSSGAYPRVGGAASPCAAVNASRRGLSPRGRGSHEGATETFTWTRPIPAWAGQPAARMRRRPAARAYPRVGGAARMVHWKVWVASGLSPRGRGSPAAHRRGTGRNGPIPAWAGQPFRSTGAGPSGRAYPRVGGAASCHFGRSSGWCPAMAFARSGSRPAPRAMAATGSIPLSSIELAGSSVRTSSPGARHRRPRCPWAGRPGDEGRVRRRTLRRARSSRWLRSPGR